MRIEAVDVRKSYGSVTALDGLTLHVPSGSTFGLLGTNGAGKTTLFKLLIGHERPDAGSVRVGELDVAEAGARIRNRIGYLPERTGFPGELTGHEVLRMNVRVRGLESAERRIDDVLGTVGLLDDADRPIEGYSNGMRRRLGLAAALVPDPDVLLLDEPTAGLDPLGVADFHRIIESVSERAGATVLVSSHALREIERLCDQAAILIDGELRAADDVTALAASGDGARTVTMWCTEPESRRRVLERCRSYGPVEQSGRRITVEVPPDSIHNLLIDVGQDADLDAIDVRDEGLESTFKGVAEGETNRSVDMTDRPESGRPQPGDGAGGAE